MKKFCERKLKYSCSNSLYISRISCVFGDIFYISNTCRTLQEVNKDVIVLARNFRNLCHRKLLISNSTSLQHPVICFTLFVQ